MIRVLIIGLGGMGKVHHMNYQLIDDVEVVGLVGNSESHQQFAKESNLPLFDSISGAAIEIDFDVVDVCTPTYLHREHVVEALEHKKHVICEKPLALTVKDAKFMFNKAKEVNKHLYVAQVVQFTQETNYLRELIQSNKYGKVIDARFDRLASIPNWVSDWMFDRDKAGLIPFDLHIHDLDLIISLFGKPTNFSVYKTQGLSDFPEHFRFIYQYEDKNIASEAAWFNASFPFTAQWRVVFEKAVVLFDGKQVITYPKEDEITTQVFESTIKLDSKINVGETDMYYRQLSHFVDCIKQDVISPLVDQGQVLSVLEILERINRSY